MTDIIPVLTEMELEIFRLRWIERLDAKTIANKLGIELEEVEKSIINIAKKREVITNSHQLRSLLGSFCRSLETDKLILIHEKMGQKKVFNVDYSILHVRTNPEESRPFDLQNVGYTFFLFFLEAHSRWILSIASVCLGVIKSPRNSCRIH